MALFAGKKPAGSCVEQVKAMKMQGFSNDQIIASLQKDGYNSAEIVDALNKAEAPPPGYPQQSMDYGPAPRQENINPNYPPPSGYRADPMMAQSQSQPMAQQTNSGYDLSSAEELIEAIIDEKWNDLVKDINKIIDWKNKTDTKITMLEQQFNDLKANFDKVHQAIIGKIGEYDKNLLEVGTEIKAMEKVFSKVLPIFTENVSELSRITDKIKKK
jgi:hypothetical protein